MSLLLPGLAFLAVTGYYKEMAKLTTAQFVERAKAAHGDRFDYSCSDYQGALTKIAIVCSSHGLFMQLPTNHWRGAGCKECRKTSSPEIRRTNAAKRQARLRERQRHTPEYKIANFSRVRLYKALSSQGIRKNCRTADWLGCSPAELRDYIAAKFEDGMTWENFGEWEVDHIRPCASFDLTDPVQRLSCFHFTNLQPLWRGDNRRKSAKLLA